MQSGDTSPHSIKEFFNMIKRIITGICVALFWVTLLAWAPTWCMFPVLLGCTLVCIWEYCNMVKRGGMEVSRKFLLTFGALWLAWCYVFPIFPARESFWYNYYMAQGSPDTFFDLSISILNFQFSFMLLITGLFALFFRVLFAPKVKNPLEMLGTTLLGFFYVPLMLGFFIRLAQWGATDLFAITREGILLAAYLALIVKAGDCGAYATGMAFGKHKMFPRISPKKSWEGLAGGLALPTLLSMGVVWLAQKEFITCAVLKNFSFCEAAIVGFVLCAIGVFGDLVESMLKRATNTKDSSETFPGRGGLLDIFDSLIFAPAAFYFYLLIVYA
jgi:CDP-diglyceride synthetase